MAVDKKITELTPIPSGIVNEDISVLVRGATDYKFTFTELAAYISSVVPAGAVVTFSNTTPPNSSGKNGDVVIKPGSGQFWQRQSGVWVQVYTVPAATSGNQVLYGSGVPNNATGNNGDTYVNTDSGIFYQKVSGAWVQKFSMATGPTGPRGNSVLNGTTDPGGGTGVEGDFYINKTTLNIFGPKTGGAWGSGTSLKGTNGNAVLNGNTAPSNLTGVNGDFYINTAAWYIYGPKASGAWPAGVSLIGEVMQPEVLNYAAGSTNPISINMAVYTQFGNYPTASAFLDLGGGQLEYKPLWPPVMTYVDGVLSTIEFDVNPGDVTTLDDITIILKS